MKNDFDLSWGDIIDMCHTCSVFVSTSSIVFVRNVPPKDTIYDRAQKFEKQLLETTKYLNGVSAQLSQNSFLANAPKEVIDGRIKQLIELEENHEGLSKLVNMLGFASQYKLQDETGIS